MSSFIAVAEEGSYTAAANRLGKTKALISMHVDKLEEALSVRLISRTTRSLHLTDTGSAYYEEAKRVLDDISTLESNITEKHQTLTGRLRLSAPTTFGEIVLMPFLTKMETIHPNIEFDINLNDRYVDLVAEGFDASIRIGKLKDSNLIARPVGISRLTFCASPAFIARYGTPTTPEELSAVPCVVDRNFRQSGVWALSPDINVKVSAKISVNSAMAAARIAAHGTALTLSPDFAVNKYIHTGKLVTVMEQYPLEELPIHVVYPHRQHLSPKVTMLTEALKQYLRSKNFN